MRDFSVWAPAAASVVLHLPERQVPMTRDDEGWWHVRVEAAADSTYAFSLDGGEPRPDPRGLRLPDGPHGWSQLFHPGDFTWTDGSWPGVRLEESVVYEMHVGTFTPEGTLDAAIPRLGHLERLGVTLVELLPLAPFPGRHGWGYDGVAPYAVHEPYGGPAALQRFVDAAHGRGLGVCLDVVYNHLGPDGAYLGEFGPYLTSRHETPWGAALNLDGPGSEPVRRWVLDNVTQWLRDFRLDALRLDAVHELHDERALHLLEEMSLEVDALAEREKRPLWLIAESDRNDPRTVTPRGRGRSVGGLGVHAQWVDDVHHALHVALTGETQGYYADFADPQALAKVMHSPFFHDGSWSSFRERHHGRPVDTSSLPGWRFVASLQTHDQVGNRATGDRLSATLPPGLLACGAAILLTSPWTPMLFMGEEWGAGTPWQYFTDHTDPALGEAVTRGRAAEFGAHGWKADDVPDPQAPETFQRSRLDLVRVEHDALRGTFSMRRGSHQVLVNLSHEPRSFSANGSMVLCWDDKTAAGDGEVELPAQSAAILHE
jgi:maltooligosyltrehalose trehalohydrolase